ncbi:hypothetical protein BG005_001048 [Podila minutissima]|nr:hypothetical protein BG005_001048 [Podila minutissima]
MDVPNDPYTWDAEATAKWLGATFHLPQETLQLFIEQEVDGEVLLNHLDDEALKTEFGFKIYGVRCRMLKQIRMLKGDNTPTPTLTAGSNGSPAITGRMAALNIVGAPFTLSSPLLHGAQRFDVDYAALDEQKPLVMLSNPLQISGPRHAKFNPIREHPLEDADSDDVSDISLMDDSERSSDDDIDISDDSDDSADIRESQPLSMRVQSEGALQTPHNLSDKYLSTTLPSTAIKKRISPILVSAAITSVTAPPLVSTSTAPTNPSRQSLTPPVHQASNTTVHTKPPTDDILSSRISPSPTTHRRTIAPTLVQDHTDHTAPAPIHPSPRKDRKGTYLPQMGLTLAKIFYNRDGTRLESESDSDDWTIRPTRAQRRSMQSGYKRLVQQNLKRIFREPPIFDLPEHTVYAPLKRKDRNVPVTVVSKSTISPIITTSTWDQMFQELASSTIRVKLQTDDMTSFDFKAATKGHAKTREQSAVQQGDDFLYPAYGESDASAYTTDEELHRQVAREERESMKQKSKALKPHPKKRPLPIADVEQLVTQYVMDRGDRWGRIEQPKLASKRQKIYDAPNGRKFELDLLRKEINQLKEKRLQDAIGAMMTTTYHAAAEVLRACKALDHTIDLISLDQWKVEVLNGPDPSLDPPQIETKPAYVPKGAPRANRTRVASIDPEEQRQRELDKAFIEDDINVDISDDSAAESEYGTADDIDMEDVDVPSEPELAKETSIRQSHTTPEERQEPSKKDNKKYPTGAYTDSPQDEVGKKRKTRDASPIEITAKKPRDYSNVDVIVIEDEDVNNDPMASPNEDATVPTSMLGSHKISVNTDPSEQPLSRQASKKVPRDDQSPRKSSGSRDTSTVDKKRARESNYSSPQFELGMEKDPSTSWSSRRIQQKSDTAMDIDPQPSQAGEPKPTPRKEMETPNWMEVLDLDTLPDKLRAFRRCKSRAQRFPDMEPLLSAYQEYIEWIELDVEDNLSVKKFIAWKRQGHTTNEYRKQAVLAAKELAEKEEKERRDKEQRDRDRKDEERREKARRGKEKEKEQEQEQEQENEASSQQQSSSTSRKPPFIRQRSILSIDDDTEDEVLMTGKSEILEIDEVMMEGKTEIHEAGKDKGASRRIVRKRRKVDAGSSGSLSSDSEPTFKKRARPAHRFGDTDDDSSSDSDSNPGPTRTRHPRAAVSMKDEAEHVLRIRKDAEKNELELQKRIKDQERRGQIQSTMTASGTGAILINRGHKKTEKSVPIPDFLLEHLKPHQIDGIVFMWKNVVMFDNGCILAHSMGLGKTFQVISFIYILLSEIQAGNKDIPKKLRAGRVMLLVPPIVLDNWGDEFNKWIPESEQHVVNVTRLPSNDRSTNSRLAILEQWYTKGGVLLLSYDLFRNLSDPPSSTPYLKGELDRMRQLLLKPGASITIADEGHTIKNAEAKISIAVSKIQTTARVILTGYPLQNRLEEYWCMVDFVWPNYLGDLQTFKHNYIRPIQGGLYPDSSGNDKKVSAKKLKVLTELIKHFVMRRDQSILRATLPKKVEFMISCKLTPMQYELYQRYLAVAGRNQSGILAVYHVFSVICNHPAIFRSVVGSVKEKVRTHMMQSPPTIAGPSMPTTSAIAAPSDNVPVSDNALVSAGDGAALGDNVEAAINLENDDELGTLAIERAISQSQEITKEEDWSKILTSNVVSVANSFKMKILLDILVECKKIKEKVLVFSRSIPTLDFVEHLLETMGSFRYLRMDGQTAVSDRQGMINHFNAKEYDLFLVSSGSGSQGINLVSANRVVIIDVGWNPSIDEQSVARAFRYGQTRKVFVYRLQTHGTFESKVYKNNLQKLSLANRVVDKKNIAKNFTKQELNSYFEPPPKANPEWSTDDNISRLLGQPDMNDAVLAKVIEQNRECLTNVVPTTDLIREEMSDLTEADLEDIEKMIIEERVRIQAKPGQPPPPRNGAYGPLPGLPGKPGLPGQPGAQAVVAGHLMPTTATLLSTLPSQPGPLAPQPQHAPNVQHVSTAHYVLPPVMGASQPAALQRPSPYVSAARYGPPSMASSFLLDAVHGASPPPMTGTIVVPPRIEDNSLPGLTTEAPVPTISALTQPGAGFAASATISPVQEMQDMEKQIRQLNKDFVNTYVKDTV